MALEAETVTARWSVRRVAESSPVNPALPTGQAELRGAGGLREALPLQEEGAADGKPPGWVH